MLDMGDCRLLGLCGYAGSGKTYLAHDLCERMARQGEKVMVKSFAEPIKQMLVTFLLPHLGTSEVARLVYGKGKGDPLDALQGKSVRQAMQTLGTEWGRNLIGPNLWTDFLFRNADPLLERGYRIIIDDVRFNSETAAIWDRGGQVIRVHNPEIEQSMTHVSEHLPHYSTTHVNEVRCNS